MAQTAITICNSAIVKLGGRQIVGFNDGTPEADLCKIRYPFCRNLLLRDHVWAFDQKFSTLAALVSTDPVPPSWTNQFDVPTDCARIVAVTTYDDLDVPYERIGGRIYTNTTSIDVRYTKNYTAIDEGVSFPDDFAEVLSLYLAMDVCLSLTQNVGLRNSLEQQYHYRLAQAKFNGAVERPSTVLACTGWLDAHAGWQSDVTDPRNKDLAN